MRKSLISLVLALSLSSLPAFSANTPKAGSACTKKGVTKTYKGKEFKCLKKGGKLVWSKGKIVNKETSVAAPEVTPSPSPTPTPTSTPKETPKETPTSTSNESKSIKSPCDIDQTVDPFWKDMQNYFAKNSHCLGPLKVVEIVQPTETPSSSLTTGSKLLNINECKLKAPQGVNVLRAWPSDYQLQNGGWRKFPGPNTVIQIVPIYTSDSAQPIKSPEEDYGKYFEFLNSVVRYDSDNGSKFEIRVPKKYYKLSKSLQEYGVTHEGGSQDQNNRRDIYTREIISTIDPEVDFSGVDLVLAVTPPGTSINLSVSTALSDFRADGKYLVVAQATPYTLTTPLVKHFSLVSPMWWFHELFHSGAGLADHNGSNYWQNNFNGDPNEYGMGNWGLMSMSITDLLALEKWVLGYISDQQVACVNQSEVTQVWLSPSTFKSKNTKLAVIPINDHQAILAESQRAGGLNYMLDKQSEGVLLYFLDTAETDREFGLKLITRSDLKVSAKPFVLFDAPLKLDESVTFKDFEIKVIESGVFGDVIRVTKK